MNPINTFMKIVPLFLFTTVAPAGMWKKHIPPQVIMKLLIKWDGLTVLTILWLV